MKITTENRPGGATPGVARGAQIYSHVYCNTSGQVVARLDGQVLRKTAKQSRHLLKKPLAWAFDIRIIEQAKNDGAAVVEVYDTESKRTYRASIADFEFYGFVFNRGFGDQIGLPLSRWKTVTSATDQPSQLVFKGLSV